MSEPASNSASNETKGDSTKEDPKQKAIHDSLVSSLVEQRKSIIDFAFKHGTVVVALLGFLLGSKDAKETLNSHYGVQFWVLTTITLLYGCLYVFWVHGMWKHSGDIFELVKCHGYVDKGWYSHQIITKKLMGSYIVMHLGICAGIIIVLWAFQTTV